MIRQPQAHFIGPSYQARHRAEGERKVYKASQKGTPREEKEMRGILFSPLWKRSFLLTYVFLAHVRAPLNLPHPSPLPRFSSSFWEMSKGRGAGSYVSQSAHSCSDNGQLSVSNENVPEPHREHECSWDCGMCGQGWGIMECLIMKCEGGRRKRLDAWVTSQPCLPGTVQIFTLKFLYPDQALSLGNMGQSITLPHSLLPFYLQSLLSLFSPFMLSL